MKLFVDLGIIRYLSLILVLFLSFNVESNKFWIALQSCAKNTVIS